MTDDELRERFDKIEADVAGVKVDVAGVKSGVSLILKHFDIPDELQNVEHVTQRISKSSGRSSGLPHAAKGK